MRSLDNVVAPEAAKAKANTAVAEMERLPVRNHQILRQEKDHKVRVPTVDLNIMDVMDQEAKADGVFEAEVEVDHMADLTLLVDLEDLTVGEDLMLGADLAVIMEDAAHHHSLAQVVHLISVQ